MNLKIEESSGCTIVFLKEARFDANNSDEFKSEINKLFTSGKNRIIVDLSDVHFIDSSGLGALVSGYKNACSNNGYFKLSALQSQVKTMFELTRLQRVFEIYQTADDALV